MTPKEGSMTRKERRKARRAERDRISGYDSKTGIYYKGGLAMPNVPAPTIHDAPPNVRPARKQTQEVR